MNARIGAVTWPRQFMTPIRTYSALSGAAQAAHERINAGPDTSAKPRGPLGGHHRSVGRRQPDPRAAGGLAGRPKRGCLYICYGLHYRGFARAAAVVVRNVVTQRVQEAAFHRKAQTEQPRILFPAASTTR